MLSHSSSSSSSSSSEKRIQQDENIGPSDEKSILQLEESISSSLSLSSSLTTLQQSQQQQPKQQQSQQLSNSVSIVKDPIRESSRHEIISSTTTTIEFYEEEQEEEDLMMKKKKEHIVHIVNSNTTGRNNESQKYYYNNNNDFDLTTIQSTKSSSPYSIQKFNPILFLFVGLILSTTLALCSALDATLNCTLGTRVWLHFGASRNNNYNSNDNDDYYQSNNDDNNNGDGAQNYYYQNHNYYYDDDTAAQQNYNQVSTQAESCKNLFLGVLVPVGFIVLVISIICCKWTIRDDTTFQTMEQNHLPTNNNRDNSNNHSVDVIGTNSQDRKRYEEFKAYVINQRNHLHSCYKLFLLAFICCSLWSYAMYKISDDSDEIIENTKNAAKNLFTFQYQSLGALNNLGEVGQNANLYYSSWISLILTFALVYDLVHITHKQRVSTKNLETELKRISRHMGLHTKEVEMVMTWSKAQQQMVKVKKSRWHESLYKLRFRAGFWLVVLVASIVIYCSSSRIWINYIYPMAIENGEIDDDGTICTIMDGFQTRDIFGLLHPSLCQRTLTSKAIGFVCSILSLAALGAHYYFATLIAKEMETSSIIRQETENQFQMQEKRKKLVPLKLEFVFAFILTIMLVYNGIFVTAVNGPGAKVGNLYYSSWISFVMSMLIMLGCLEDIVDQEDEEEEEEEKEVVKNKNSDESQERRNISKWLSVRPIDEIDSPRLIMLPSSQDDSQSEDDMTIGSFIGGMPIPSPNGFHQVLEKRLVHEEEASRSTRLRRWASSCIYSFIYLVSALDAAFHSSNYDILDVVQMTMVISSCIMVTFCFIMTGLCILDYKIVDSFYVGGLISVLLMILWVGCLILTLHNNSSWAVNKIGEIQNANLYYFTWATVLNTGMLSSSYVGPFMKKQYRMKRKGLMVVLWLAVVKICFVMFGSCIDILLSIKDQCQSANQGDDTDVFCKRTEAGAVFGFIGMATGVFAALYRFYVPFPSIKGLMGESIMSTILAIIFALSLAMVTGIGGPGQAVGDLYYGSWLAFLAALGVACGLYTEVSKKTKESIMDSSDIGINGGDKNFNSITPYSMWNHCDINGESGIFT